MEIVKGDFPDYSKYGNKGWFKLQPDKGFNPYTWAPPINWTGMVNGTDVSFVQISASGTFKDDYDWTGFPEQYNDAISYIVAAIDKAMRVMD